MGKEDGWRRGVFFDSEYPVSSLSVKIPLQAWALELIWGPVLPFGSKDIDQGFKASRWWGPTTHGCGFTPVVTLYNAVWLVMDDGRHQSPWGL